MPLWTWDWWISALVAGLLMSVLGNAIFQAVSRLGLRAAKGAASRARTEKRRRVVRRVLWKRDEALFEIAAAVLAHRKTATVEAYVKSVLLLVLAIALSGLPDSTLIRINIAVVVVAAVIGQLVELAYIRKTAQLERDLASVVRWRERKCFIQMRRELRERASAEAEQG